MPGDTRPPPGPESGHPSASHSGPEPGPYSVPHPGPAPGLRPERFGPEPGGRLAILSDIHSNLEALRAVLADLDRRFPGPSPDGREGDRPPRIVCLGDMVGYGADPEAVVALLRERDALAVMGNHELGVVKPACRRYFNPQARQAVAWTAAALSGPALAWLAGLPFFLSVAGCRMVHGLPPDHPTIYLQAAPDQVLARVLGRLPEDCCFVGHTHRLGRITLRGGVLTRLPLAEGRVLLAPEARHLVNAGAVGQPRDGDFRAKYCLYDPGTRLLEVCCVAYDPGPAAAKILAAGLPAVYARRLGPER